MSGSTSQKSPYNDSQKESPHQLAERILSQVTATLCVKLRELKPELLRLRDYFTDSKVKKPIAGCRTWDEFCEKKLHHTSRAVRKLLNEKAKEEQKSAEQSSAKASSPERTIIDVDADNLGDVTRRTKSYFEPKAIEERKRAFVAWVKTVADDLGLSIEVVEVPKAFTVAPEEKRREK